MVPQPAASLRVFENDAFTADQSDSCALPGYLIVRIKREPLSMGELDPRTSAALGVILSRAVRAIEESVGAERVYCLVFAEIDRRLHFHLFPRTAWLLERYWNATNTTGEPVNGPMLFEWARTVIVSAADLPAGSPSVEQTCQTIRRKLLQL